MKITLVFPLLLATALLAFFFYYWHAMSPKKGSLEWIVLRESRPVFTFRHTRHPMGKKDALPLFLVTLVYTFTAFFQLGSTAAPQSFQRFDTAGDTAVYTFALSDPSPISGLRYYTGLNTGDYTVEWSADGFFWTEVATLSQQYSELFKWQDASFSQPVQGGQFRLTAHPHSQWIELGELAFLDADGQLMVVGDETVPLFDERETVPSQPHWFNSTYFDEIYHARTAYEHLEGVYPYEVSHPPLGKLIISVGVALFGMTPFGWRFMGTLFGVLMLPVFYVFLKNLFGKTPVALCGTILLAADFMHLTQTRIATIDTYAVFFILLSFFFLYRFFTAPRHDWIPLCLCGLFWGIGVACKWTVIYAGAGLAILYFIHLVLRWRSWPADPVAPRFAPWLVRTLLLSVVFFVAVPAAIYMASYLPYAWAKGDMTLSGLWSVVVENQKFMFTYHSGVTDEHSYSSRWYQWLFDIRPILYYMDNTVEGFTTRFAAFNNPVVSWGGLLALAITAVEAVRSRCGKALVILVGYLAQLVPWIFIGRITFAYHYFPATLFLILALCYAFYRLTERAEASWRWPMYGLTATAAGLYAAYYPVLIGLQVPTWYTGYFLRWFPSWPI